MIYKLVVYGDPKAQGRPRARRIGKFIQVYDDPKSAKAKDTMAVIIQQKAPEQLLAGPLRVDIHCFFLRPKSHFGTGRNAGILKASAPEYYTKKPDRDNLDKLVLDALTSIFFVDDCQACRGGVERDYADEGKPRTEIVIEELRAEK